MRILNPVSVLFSSVICFLVTASPHLSAETLGEILRKSKWDRIIGTWAGTGLNPRKIKITYSWKIKDQVIEIITKEENKETVALMAVNAKTNEIFIVSANNRGGTTFGKWELKENHAVLKQSFTSPDGSQGRVTIRHQLTPDNRRMFVTIQLPQPTLLRLERIGK